MRASATTTRRTITPSTTEINTSTRLSVYHQRKSCDNAHGLAAVTVRLVESRADEQDGRLTQDLSAHNLIGVVQHGGGFAPRNSGSGVATVCGLGAVRR